MKHNNRKPDKRTKLKRLKRYINKENLADLAAEILVPIIGFRFIHAVTGEDLTEFPSTKPPNYKIGPVWPQELRYDENPEFKGNASWDGEKLGMSYNNDQPNESEPEKKQPKKKTQVPVDLGHKMNSALTEQYRNIFN
jgi:hypothetical protein